MFSQRSGIHIRNGQDIDLKRSGKVIPLVAKQNAGPGVGYSDSY